MKTQWKWKNKEIPNDISKLFCRKCIYEAGNEHKNIGVSQRYPSGMSKVSLWHVKGIPGYLKGILWEIPSRTMGMPCYLNVCKAIAFMKPEMKIEILEFLKGMPKYLKVSLGISKVSLKRDL